MRLTAGQLNRTTLERQLLLRREQVTVVDAVARAVALQAQTAASPYLALWARVHRFDPTDLDAAFVARAVVKATLVRATLHAVAGVDHPSFHQAMEATLRATRLVDPQRITVGRRTMKAEELSAAVVHFASEPRTGNELQNRVQELTGSGDRRLWRAVRTFAPLTYVADGGAWSFTASPTFVAAPAAASGLAPMTPLEATSRLMLRYLQGFGPASVRDCGQFTMLRQPLIRAALADLGERVIEYSGPAGEQLFDVADGRISDADTHAPARLLGMWDSILLAYADRARVLPSDHRRWIIRRNGDVLPTLLVDGEVVGVWRALPNGIEATAFRRLDQTAWAGLEAEAVSLRALLCDRDPQVYRRFGHWWDKEMPAAERRVLGE